MQELELRPPHYEREAIPNTRALNAAKVGGKVNSDRTLRQVDIETLESWLQQKLPDFKCPLCGSQEINFAMFGMHRLKPSLGGPNDGSYHLDQAVITPFVSAECNRCAHILLFNSKRMGVADDIGDGSRPLKPLK